MPFKLLVDICNGSTFHGNLAFIPNSKGAFYAVVLIAKRSYLSCNANFQRNYENCIFSLKFCSSQ